MTNDELFSKVQEEIPRFQIGFHQISLHKYRDVIENGGERAVEFKIGDREITEQKIAKHILNSGFNVWDRAIGFGSTSYFPKELLSESFNYKYYSKAESVCNLIFAIPYNLTYQGKSYFIGNLSMSFSFGNRLLFNSGVIPEFIYGYYEKETPVTRNPFPEYHYSNDLIFYENDRFWLNLSPEEQKKAMQRLFSEKKKAYHTLRLINSYNPVALLTYDKLERLVIRETRRQKKLYVKSLTH